MSREDSPRDDLERESRENDGVALPYRVRELALCSGAGGSVLAAKLLGWETVAAVEASAFEREVLLRRQRDGVLPVFPIWDDLRTFDGRPFRRAVDVVTAGFPCQPWSAAGKKAGREDDRNLWPDVRRVLDEVRPPFALLENVSGLLSDPYVRRVFGDLAAIGFDAEWDCFPAASLGAPHLRDRLFVLASNSRRVSLRVERERDQRDRRGVRETEREPTLPRNDGAAEPMADRDRVESEAERDPFGRESTRALSGLGFAPGGEAARSDADGERLSTRGAAHDDDGGHALGDVARRLRPDVSESGSERLERIEQAGATPETIIRSDRGEWESWWRDDPGEPKGEAQPVLGRVADGVPYRVDRLKAIGNAWVPVVARSAVRALALRAGWELTP